MQEQSSAPVAQTQADEVKVQAKNFAELRNAADAVKQENVLLKQRLSQLEESVKKAPLQQELDDDGEPYVDKKRLQKEMGKLKDSLETEIDKKAEEKARALIAEERKKDFFKNNKDFHEIMQQDEIQKFISEQPGLAEDLEMMPDSFERQKVVYRMIKTLKEAKPAQVSTPAQPKSPLAAAFDSRKAAMAYQPGGSSGGPFQSLGDFSQGGMKNAYDRFKSLQKTVHL